jgi:hypothetical protein
VVDARGGQPTVLTSDAGNDSDPHWSADGGWIYFTSDREGSRTHWKVPARGGSAARTGLPIGSRESPEGEGFYYDGDDGLWRIAREGEPPVRIVDASSRFSAWKITRSGVYYVEGEAPCCVVPGASPEDPGRPLMFLDFASGRRIQIAFLAGYQGGAIDVSPDHSAIMYTRRDGFDVDLMLVENFR